LRHPTAIRLASAAAFVPNSIELGVSGAAFVLLTGPNMGGKSTLMRQVRLLGFMAAPVLHLH
jgi:DNA mismatch repair ATPase MutS